MDLDSLEEEIAVLDLLLRDIAQRPVDTTDPDWIAKLSAQRPAAEEAGVAAESAAALAALLDAYEAGDDRTREAVRHIFRAYPSFSWGAGLSGASSSVAEFRRQLIHISARDQAQDPRDELVALWEMCAEGRERGIDIEPIVREVASISSDVDHYGMGSTRRLLMRGLESRG